MSLPSPISTLDLIHNDLNMNMRDTRIFSKLDFVCSYHPIPIGDRRRIQDYNYDTFLDARVCTNGVRFEEFCPNVQKFINGVFSGLDFVFVLYDMLVLSENKKKHFQHLDPVFKRLEEYRSNCKLNRFSSFSTLRGQRIELMQNFVDMVYYYHKYISKVVTLCSSIQDMINSAINTSRKYLVREDKITKVGTDIKDICIMCFLGPFQL